MLNLQVIFNTMRYLGILSLLGLILLGDVFGHLWDMTLVSGYSVILTLVSVSIARWISSPPTPTTTQAILDTPNKSQGSGFHHLVTY